MKTPQEQTIEEWCSEYKKARIAGSSTYKQKQCPCGKSFISVNFLEWRLYGFCSPKCQDNAK